MKKRYLYGAWILLYALCAGLGHMAEPTHRQATAHTLLSILFFVPGYVLLVCALLEKDQKTLRLLRLLSICSLGLTLAALIANVAAALGSDLLGTILHEVLIFVSVPMICSRHWVLSLFLWACLLLTARLGRKKA